MDTVVIATFPDIVTAIALHEILVEAGIECQLVNGSETVFPTDVMDAHALLVRSEDADRARALLDEAEAAAELGYADAGLDDLDDEEGGEEGGGESGGADTEAAGDQDGDAAV
jgi:hypothetical protein